MALQKTFSQPQARARSEKQVQVVKDLSDRGASNRDILTALSALDEPCLLTERDVMNIKKNLRAEEQDGVLQMQFLVDFIHREGHKFSMKTGSSNTCTDLLIVPQQTLEFTQDFDDIVQMDSTYRTNRYGMPLLLIVGRTNTNTTFTMGLCFLRSEAEANYQWALSEFAKIVGPLIRPRMILTDRELALMNAIRDVFPAATNILCVWHITKNFSAQCKKLFLTDDAEADAQSESPQITWKEFSKKWSKLVINTLSIPEFNDTWRELQTKIPVEAVSYTQNSWVTLRKEHFCLPYLLDVIYNGTMTTSRVEGCHAVLKR